MRTASAARPASVTLVATLLTLLATELAAAAPQDLFVTSRNRDKIVRYDGETGAFVENFVTFGSGGLDRTQDLLWGPDGHLYVSGFGNTAVLKYHGSTGEFLGEFTHGFDLSSPTKMTLRPDGHLYVSQWGGSQKVVRFDMSTGAYTGEATETALSGACQQAWDSEGNLYVAYWGTIGSDGGVRKFSATGQDLGDFDQGGVLQGPVNLWFDGADLLVLDWTTGSAERLDSEGRHSGTFLSGLTNAEGFTFGPDGFLYVCDWTQNHVKKFTPDGSLVGVFASGNNLIAPNACLFGLAESVGAAADPPARSRARLRFVAPNPFRDEVGIHLSMPEAAPVRARVFDVAGRELEELHSGLLAAGDHVLGWDGFGVPAGVYWLKLETPGQTVSRKLTRLQ